MLVGTRSVTDVDGKSAMEIEQRLSSLDLQLPPEPQLPPGMRLPFSWVRVHKDRAYVSGHTAQAPDGSPFGPFGKIPSQVSLEQAQQGSRLLALTVLGALQRALADLDRVEAWLTVTAMINADPGYDKGTLIVNPFSELLLEVFGPDAGAHARTAVGVAALPFDSSIIVAAELAIR